MSRPENSGGQGYETTHRPDSPERGTAAPSAVRTAMPVLKPVLIAALLMALVVMFLTTLAVGSVSIPVEDVVRVLLGHDVARPSWTRIILDFRLPQAITAILAGAGLGVAGLLMQTFFRNPLADPFVLGVSSGASLGVALVVLAVGGVTTSFLAGLGLMGDLALAVAASAGAAVVLMIVLFAARRIASGMSLLVLGLLFGYLTSAAVSLLLYFSIPERIQAYITWTFGSFTGVTWGQLVILGPMIAGGLFAAFLLGKPLNALLLGESYAFSMGINLMRARFAILTTTAVLAGTITAFCGPIGFIGIAVPHLCRSLFNTADHHQLTPLTMLVGALVALIAAFAASVPGSNIVLPLNAVTSLIGAPVVIWVLLRRQNIKESFSS